MENEKTLTYKSSRIYFIPDYLIGCVTLLILFSLIPFLDFSIFSTFLFIFVFLVGIFFILEPEAKVRYERCVLTPSLIFIKKLKGKIIEIPYQEIESLKIENNLLSGFLNIGNILITTPNGKVKIVGISNPSEVCKILEYKRSEIKRRKIKEELDDYLKDLKKGLG